MERQSKSDYQIVAFIINLITAIINLIATIIKLKG